MSRTPLTKEASDIQTSQHRLYQIFLTAGKKAPELQALVVQNPSASPDLLKEAFATQSLRPYVLKNKAFLRDQMSSPFFAKAISDELHQVVFASSDLESVLDTLNRVEIFNVYSVQNILRNPLYSKALDVAKIDEKVTNNVKALSLGDTMIVLGCLGTDLILSLSAHSYNVQNLALSLFKICMSKAEKRLDQLNNASPKTIEAMLEPQKEESKPESAPQVEFFALVLGSTEIKPEDTATLLQEATNLATNPPTNDPA